MRNKNRIPKILKEIEKIWLKQPNLRLGQLLVNACDGDGRDLYYWEDNMLVRHLKSDQEWIDADAA